MNRTNRLTKTGVVFAGLLALGATALPSLAKGLFEGRGFETRLERKLSPVLLKEVRRLARHPQYDQPIPVIVKMRRDFLVDREASGHRSTRRAPNALPLVDAYTSRLDSRGIRALLESDDVEYVTVDAVVRPAGKPVASAPAFDTPVTIGAPLLHDLGIKGGGVTIAVFDSGINPHSDLPIKSRVRVAMDFTSGEGVEVKTRGSGYQQDPDQYGHGTHVAGTVGGDGKRSKGLYAGVAPKAKFVDVKVVGPDGSGLTSNLIKAIDWVIQNREKYEIRVANMSLGHPPLESYVNDPLGQAVERMVQAGIITVASAGNVGEINGVKIYGAISSPGNHPAVITVSATNTMGTATQSDDVAALFSSRGPTYADLLFKPDLTAPGTDVTSIYSQDTWIAKNYPQLTLDNYYMRLSGSSMATAHVSGTVALMLSANPDLTPRMVKALLLLTASKLRQPHMFEQGNGMVNAYGAAMAGLTLKTRDQLVVGVFDPTWQLDGETVYAGGAFAVADRIVYSDLVLAEARGQLWGSGVDWCPYLRKTAATSVNEFFQPGSGLWYSSDVSSDAIFWSDAVFWVEAVFWIDNLFWVDGMFWSEGAFWAEYMLQTAGLATHDFSGQ